MYTENITLAKYPTYAVYQRRVAMFGFFKTLEMSLWYRLFDEEQRVDDEKVLWGSDKGKGKKD